MNKQQAEQSISIGSTLNISKEKIQQKREQKKKFKARVLEQSVPFSLTRRFVSSPWIGILIFTVLFIIFDIVTIVEEIYKMSDSGNRDFLIWDNERVEDYDAYKLADDLFNKSKNDQQMDERTIENYDYNTHIIMECVNEEKNCNIISPETISELYMIEQKILNLEDYNEFCLIQTNQNDGKDCSDALISITQWFSNPSTVTQDQINEKLVEITENKELYDKYKLLFDDGFWMLKPESSIIRSIFKFGMPLKVDGKLYKDQFDETEKQDEHFEKFAEKIQQVELDVEEDYKFQEDVNLMFYSSILQDLQFIKQINSDQAWIMGSILFVWFYLTIHLKSFYLSTQGIIMIIQSFPITFCLYRYILQITYVSTLQAFIIFVVLGIGADDIFVMFDAWEQSGRIKYIQDDLDQRMAYTFRRASRAMLATSSTTSAAFLVSGFSEIMPIASFGIFAGILIPINYILVILYYPVVIISYEKYIKGMWTRLWKKCFSKKNEGNVEGQEVDMDYLLQDNFKQQNKQDNIVEKFFYTSYNSFVYKFRYFIVVIILIWVIIAFIFAFQVSPLTEQENFFPEDHDTTKSVDLILYKFHNSGQGEKSIKIKYIFGIKGIDKSSIQDSWDSEDYGEPIFDEDFDLSSQSNQQWLYNFCVNTKKNALIQDEEVVCFMEDFKIYIESKKVNQDGEEYMTFPVDSSQFLQQLQLFTKEDEKGKLYYNLNNLGIIDNKLKYVVIEMAGKGTPYGPYEDLNPIYEKWEDFLESTKKSSPDGLKSQIQTAGFSWVWMITERAFVNSAIQGMLIALAFSLLVLLITTLNIYVSIISVFCISSIVGSVIAIMKFYEWELGLSESITIVMVIGLSVDYIVHLANHYIECAYSSKHKRVQMALKEVGISIISGAITTGGSSIFLLFTVLTIFYKFGVFIFSTISFSVIMSLLFLPSLLHIIGPQNESGYILQYCRKRKQQKYAEIKKIQEENEIQEKNEIEMKQFTDQYSNIKDKLKIKTSKKTKQPKLQEV